MKQPDPNGDRVAKSLYAFDEVGKTTDVNLGSPHPKSKKQKIYASRCGDDRVDFIQIREVSR